jgi:hypothetical protein
MGREPGGANQESEQSFGSGKRSVIEKSRRRTRTILAALAVAAIAVVASYVVLVGEPSPLEAERAISSIHTIDTNVVGWDYGQGTSISTDSTNKVHICYYDGMNQDLKYATNSSGSWKNFTLDSSGDVGEYNSMAIDSDDKIHMSYCDTTNQALKYATNAGGSWMLDTICQGRDRMLSSIAIDSENGVYIAYRDPTSSELRYATKVNGSWTHHAIASTESLIYYSIAIGADDSLHVIYSGRNQALTYATNSNGAWVYQVLSVANCSWCSIALGPNDDPHISYLGETQDYRHGLNYASNANGTWTSITLYDEVGDFNTGTSIAIDSENKTHIGFFDSDNWYVMYATNEGGSWECYIADDAKYVGDGTSMTLDSDNRVHFSYFDRWERDLKCATVAASP